MAGFRSAPLLLFRFPATLVAVLVASLLLAVAGAASPLFVSSAGNAAIRREIAADEGRVPALEVRKPSALVPDVLAYRDRTLRYYAKYPGLRDPVLAVVGSLATITAPGLPEGESVRVMTRQLAEDELEFVAGDPTAEGVWISDRVVERTGLAVGDRISVVRDRSFRTRVAAVYHDLYLAERRPYWTPFTGLIDPADPDDAPPPSFLLAPYDTFLRMQPRLDDRAEMVWHVQLDGLPTLDEARVLAARLQRFGGTLSDETTSLGGALSSANYLTPIPTYVQQAEATVGSILSPIETISLAGRGVALAVVIAAGVYIVRRRRVEFALLAARGVSPLRLGIRAGVEAILPLAAGAALGTVAAVGVVTALGPGEFTRQSVRDAAITAAIGAGVGLVALAASAAASVRSLELADAGGGRLRGVAARIPWELVVLTLAGAALYEAVLRGGNAVVGPQGQVEIDRLLLLFPLLLLAGGAGVVVRLLRRIMPRLRRVRARRSAAAYLASRRLAAAPRTAGLLVTASALGMGMLAYSGLLTDSIRGTADVKAHVAVGSDVAVELSGLEPDAPLPPRSTRVRLLEDAVLQPGEDTGLVIAIDPATFADGAYWDDSFGGSLEAAVDAVSSGAGGDLPVVLAGDAGEVSSISVSGRSIPVRVADRLEAVPGMPATTPAVVVDAARLGRALEAGGLSLDEAASEEVWSFSSAESVRETLVAQGATITTVQTVDDVRDTPSFQSLSWTFSFMQALGVAAGLIALVGLVLYLQTRQRAREISYALARRMGMKRGAHRRSVALELAGMLILALVTGVGLAFGAAILVHGKLDPLPGLPPGPVLRAPLLVLGASAGAILVAAWLGARLVQRRADRANVAEVMRAA